MGWGINELLKELREGERLLQEKAPANYVSLAHQTKPTAAVLLQKNTDRLDEITRDRFALLGTFVEKPATFDENAIAVVWNTNTPRPTLRMLVNSGLLEPVAGRFQMHSLLAAHARSLLKRKGN